MPPETEFIEAPAGAAAAAEPKVEIKVSEMTPPKEAAAPAKKGSAKESIFKDLRKLGGAEEPEPAAAPAEPKLSEGKSKEGEPPVPDSGTEKEGAIADKGKQNPWKLVENYKAEKKKLEERLAQMESAGVPPEKLKPFEDRIAQMEKRNSELEAEMRYVNYQKTDEFQAKYQKPYEEAWSRAMRELNEVTVQGDDGSERAITGQDVLQLVNMPLREAKQLAEEKFGEFAPEVMSHRKEIRRLFEEQSEALDKIRTEGAERTKQMEEERTKQFAAISDDVRKTWSEANESAKTDEKYGHYFVPIDGDTEGNQRLSKGFELADRAFSENPMQAKTAEERRAIIQRHAAVRNRAAAFGRLVYMNQQSQKRIEELEKELAGFKQAEPPAGGSASKSSSPGGKKGSSWDGIRSGLAKIAK